ncbi:hypothetical protein T09_960 [Trichinella sp. T9]|nr:hypothetical protein T09_960 [Trichinella sp. T9]
MEQRKCENTDGTKQNKRRQEVNAISYGLLSRRISFVNNGWRELKETRSKNWKIPCQIVIFGVSEKRPSSN